MLPFASLTPEMQIIFIVSAAVPVVLMLIVFAASILRSRKAVSDAEQIISDIASRLKNETLRDDELPSDGIERVFSSSENEALVSFSEKMAASSRALYAGAWLPDPVPVLTGSDPRFNRQRVLQNIRRMGWICLTIGLLSGAALFAYYSLIGVSELAVCSALPAALIGVLLSLYLFICSEKRAASAFDASLDRASQTVTAFASVFQERNGLAALISEVMRYGETMRREVRTFGRLADHLAKGQFSEGICASVREIMTREVVPPLNDANRAMKELAIALADKQDKGIAELAGSFADETSRALSEHLEHLTQELRGIQDIVSKTSALVDESTRSLEQSSREGEAVNGDIREALRLMALARNDMADEMVSISDNLKIIGASTDRMTALYAGEETDLGEQINRMTEQLRHYSETLQSGISENAKTFEACCDFSSSQSKDASAILGEMSRQIKSLESLSTAIEKNTSNFTKESSDYVVKTLKGFDSNLAEVVERLTFTTAEIRDAVDALPPAIRRVSGRREGDA